MRNRTTETGNVCRMRRCGGRATLAVHDGEDGEEILDLAHVAQLREEMGQKNYRAQLGLHQDLCRIGNSKQ